MSNAHTQLQQLLADRPLNYGLVTASDSGLITVDMVAGGSAQFFGDNVVGTTVIVQGNKVIGQVPVLAVVAIDI